MTHVFFADQETEIRNEIERDETENVEDIEGIGPANAAKLQEAGVRVEEVIGQRPTWAGAKVRVELGDLSRGEERDLFVRFQSDARRAGARR